MAQRTNHQHFVDEDGKVYCFKEDMIATLDEKYYQAHCSRCPFFNGTLQGEGVECLYADPHVSSDQQDVPGVVTFIDAQDAYENLSPSMQIETDESEDAE